MFETCLTREQVDRYTAAGHWRNHVLREYVDIFRDQEPDKPAVIDGQVTLTYAQLVEEADQVAWSLLERGTRRGDVISVQLPNWSEFVVLLLAVERIGAVLNPITPILRARELHQILEIGRARMFVVPGRFRGFDRVEMALELRRMVSSVEQIVVVRGRTPDGTIAWDELTCGTRLREEHRRLLDWLRPDANDVAELAFTSGTTGVPKGVLHTHNSVLCTVGSTLRRQALSRRSVVHVVLPVGHNAGYFYGVRIALQAGATMVLQETWDPADMARLIERHRVTFTMGATTHLIDFLDCQASKQHDLRSLEVFMCGGASIPPTVAELAVRRLPGRFCPVFGMTEHGHSTGTDASTPLEKVLSTDGSFQPEMVGRIVDEVGREQPPGQEGRLWVRGPFNFVGYVQGRAFTAPYFDANEFFDTGDLAYVDRDGYLRITGRVKNLIIRGGEKIPVKEIEDLLAAHPAVREVVLVGVPHPRLGERAVACVRLWEGKTLRLDEIKHFLDERRVTKRFWPEGLVVYDDLPRTASGKVQNFRLREDLIRRSVVPD